MWVILIPSLCLLVSIPWITKRFAYYQVERSLKLTLAQFQSIAAAYTEYGTPAELSKMIEDLEEIMEELKFLDKMD